MPHLDDAAGVKTYFFEQGRGAPLVLLHGGLESGEDWRAMAATLGADHRVLVPDRRGHGRTPDVEGPYTYALMADETAAFIEQAVVGGPVDVVGYSDGGVIALHLMIERPELVRRAIVIGTNFRYEGLVPSMLERLRHPDPDNPRLRAIREAHDAIAPDSPGRWRDVYTKVCEMGSTGPTFDVSQLHTILQPVLVVAGDDDVVDHHHTVTLFEALPHAQLAIVPGTSHLLPHEQPDELAALVQRFFDGEPRQRLMPMRTVDHEGVGA